MLAMARMSHDWSSRSLEGREDERDSVAKVSFGWVIAANLGLWAGIAAIAAIVL